MITTLKLITIRIFALLQNLNLKNSLSFLTLIFAFILLQPSGYAQAGAVNFSGEKFAQIQEEKLPVVDQGLVIAEAMAGSWEYGVYLLGLPVGLKARVQVQREGLQITATSHVDHFLAANSHQSIFSLPSCDYRLQSYQNSGFSPGWRFDDAVVFDWSENKIRYQGLTQGPKTPHAQPQTLTLTLDDAIYVDKLSQFAALACAMVKSDKIEQSKMPLSIPLSYVDDTIGRYRFSVDHSSMQMTVADQTITVIKVESEPYEYAQGSVHRQVTYWLAPSLGYLPVKISTKLGGMRLTVKMLKAAGQQSTML